MKRFLIWRQRGDRSRLEVEYDADQPLNERTVLLRLPALNAQVVLSNTDADVLLEWLQFLLHDIPMPGSLEAEQMP